MRLRAALLCGVSAVALVVALVVALGAPMTAQARPLPDPQPERAPSVTLPTPNVDWDYQIGGAFPPASGVGIVSRDRHAEPAAGAYNLCYVNAFQTQADEKAFWRNHWRLVLKKDGRPVVDSVWGEWLLDTRTPSKRHALADIVGRWTERCANDGFDAVEYDNFDSWNRSKHLISKPDNIAYARLLTARAHGAGLAAAQKNWAEIADRGPDIGFDFAVAEECARWHECGSYAVPYDDRVLVVEYRDRDFTRGCDRWGERLSIVRRDVAVSPDGPNLRC